MIAVVFALPEESKAFLRHLHPRERGGRGAELWARGTLEGQEIHVFHTGMGAEAAAAGLRRILAHARPELVLGAGFAGGLQPELGVGSVICDWRNQPPLLEPPLPAGCFAGRLLTAGAALETPAAKAELGRRTGALGVEMEGDAGARLCAEAGVPFYAIRVVSDAVTTALPVPLEHWFDLPRQRPRPAALLWFLARHPGRIAPFAAFVRGLPGAGGKLAAALTAAIAAVARARAS